MGHRADPCSCSTNPQCTTARYRYVRRRIMMTPEATVLLLSAATVSLPWTAAETLWWGGNFTASDPGGRGLNFGGGTNGDFNAIACMEKPQWRYCLIGGNFTRVGSES